MLSRENIIKFLSVATALAAFVSLFMFVNVQMDKYNYFIYLYGESNQPGAKALVKLISRDGEIVGSPKIFLNGVPQATSLIDLRPDMREIAVEFGGERVSFPLTFRDISAKPVFRAKPLHLTPQELSKPPHPQRVGGRSIFLLPEQFRLVPEFETTLNLYCVEDDKPCQDDVIIINGSEQRLKNGFVQISSVFSKDAGLTVGFHDGLSDFIRVPYHGKMFKIYENKDAVTLASLSDTRNVHIDCYSGGSWAGTDVVSVSFDGLVLPAVYKNCDTVQVSLNSASPGTMFLVKSKANDLLYPVDDPYFKQLAGPLKHFSPAAQASFARAYNSSFFQPLSVVFSGERLEKEFMKRRGEALSLYRTGFISAGLFGLLIFAYSMIRRIRVVEGEDDELISHSLKRQWFMTIAAIAFYLVSLFSIVYLFNHLA
ncbi:hypothetical protein J5834_05285 [bacterium]|nr:hypothetical protein [bacterium]